MSDRLDSGTQSGSGICHGSRLNLWGAKERERAEQAQSAAFFLPVQQVRLLPSPLSRRPDGEAR